MVRKVARGIIHSIMAFFLGGSEILIFYIRQHFFGNSIPNYLAVSDAKLYRGGQPSNRGLKQLKKHGIGTIVNLRARDKDKKAISKLFGGKMNSIHLPIIPFFPTEKTVIDFLKLFTKKENTPVYVHCFHGADRTGLMCAMYRIIFDGWEKDRAILEMKKNGFHFWHRSIISYIQNSDVESIKQKVFS